MPTVIALDAMGSDRAPKPEVEGAILAARHYEVEVLLVGREEQVRAELQNHPSAEGLPIEVVNATEVIEMNEKAAQAVRSKKDSSMRVGLRQVRDGRAAGFVTAGNEGVEFVDKNIPLLDGKKIEQWIKDLDDDSFNIRHVADNELRKLGRLVEALVAHARGNISSRVAPTRSVRSMW